MLKMRPYAPPDRIAIRDSIDEECSDDIEDDVFIRDGKSGRLNEEKGLKRPLMAPRRKNNKIPNPVPIMKKHRRCWKCCEPFCYGLAAVTVLVALIFLAALLLTLFPIPLQKIKFWLRKDANFGNQLRTFGILSPELIPCSQISVQKVWTRSFARLNSESPMRKVDLNNDKVLDIVFGYGIDDSVQYDEESGPKCMSVLQEEQVPCEGGVIALNGANGNVIWQTWAIANIFSLFCSSDLDLDGIKDCVAAGIGGAMIAISGSTGKVIWNFRELQIETNSPILIDLYTINYVRDLDGDDVADIIAAHVEDRETSRAGHIKLISGKTGKVIRSIPTPFREEVFVPLQTVVKEDGTELLLIITGGQNTPGGIYTIRLHSLMQYTSEKEFTRIFQTDLSGFMVPAVFSDITGDSVEDIIVSSFNSTVYAFDGKNYSIIWSYSFPASESVSSIVPGHFDHDNITDFMVKYNTGPGYPVYYYSQTIILNGSSGQPLLDSMMTDSGGPHSLLGGMSISQTFGGDFFLHWQTQCRGKYDVKDAYQFIPDTDTILQARADTCLLRYNASTVLKLYAIARHIEPPGAVIFSSDDLMLKLNKSDNHNSSTTDQKNTVVSPVKHPKMLKKFPTKEPIKVPKQPPPAVPAPEPAPQEKEEKKFRNPEPVQPHRMRKPDVYENKIMSIPDQVGESERNPYEQIKPYLYMPYNNPRDREFGKDYESDPRNQDEYEVLYDEVQRNERPIRLRTKYPSNRDVRSDEDPTNESIPDDDEIPMPPLALPLPTRTRGEHPLNLWDLEMEKEQQEAMSEARKYGYSHRQIRDDSENKQFGNEDFLPSISSNGVLLDPLDKSATAVDYAFVMNVRESEVYPPLFLPEDFACVEDRISGYRSFSTEDLHSLEKQFLKQCLKARMPNISRHVPRFESQIVITRISISCACGQLEKGEVCSRFNALDNQKWTEFMGNTGNGIYSN